MSFPENREITVGSNAAINAPLFRMFLSMSHAGCPLATLRSTLMARAVPARNTNVGAQICVTHLVMKTSKGTWVPGMNSAAESAERCPISYAMETWSRTMRIMTRPRIQSIETMRLDLGGGGEVEKAREQNFCWGYHSFIHLMQINADFIRR